VDLKEKDRIKMNESGSGFRRSDGSNELRVPCRLGAV
jgi:hypothetical protein